LLVINETDRSRVLLELGDSLHKVNSDLVVGEDNGIEDSNLRKRLDLHNDFSNNSNISFTAHNNMVKVHSVRLSRPKLSL
jgi:hypothetical protein